MGGNLVTVLSDRSIEERLGYSIADPSRIEIDPYDESALQGASIDLRLGSEFIIPGRHAHVVDHNNPDPIMLRPYMACLAATVERVHIPHDCVGRVEGKSSIGRQFVVIHCTPPDTMLGALEPTTIEKPSQYVIGLDGKEHLVGASIAHHYKGEMISLDVAAIPNLRCTPDHRFLVHRPLIESGTALRGTRNYHDNRVSRIEEHEKTQPLWIQASDLRRHDLLLSPVFQVEGTTEVFPILRSEHFNAIPLLDVQVDADIAWLAGMYIGNGGTMGKGGFSITSGKEGEIVSRAGRILHRFGVPVRHVHAGTYERVIISSRDLVRTFVAQFGSSAENKHIPAWLMRSQFRASVLEGLLDADGHTNVERGQTTFTTISRPLAWQVWHLAIACGYRPSFRNRKQGTGYSPSSCKPLYEIGWTYEGRHHSCFHWRNYYAMPVRSIERESYDGEVYTLSVPSSESYLTNGVISHNCTAGWIDPGFNGRITLEIANHNPHDFFLLEPGMFICQLTFLQLDRTAKRIYRGKYHNAIGVEGAKS